MKLLIVTPYFHPRIGGLESYVYYLCKKITHYNKWDLVVITSNEVGQGDKSEIIESVKVYRLSTLFTISNTPVNPTWIYKIWKIIQAEKPDVINAHSPVPFIADITSIIAWVKQIPFILTYHAGSLKKGMFLTDLMSSLYSQTFEKLMFTLSCRIIALNPYVKEVTLKKHSASTVFIPPGITMHDHKMKYTKYSNVRKLLFVGKLEKTHAWKGLNFLIHAMRLLNDNGIKCHLNVVGGGNNLSKFKQQSTNLNIQHMITFVGTKPNSAIYSFYESSGILILPSYSNAESLGLVILEAIAHGIPVIASKIGGIPYTIKNNVNGILTTPKDPHSIAEAVKNLVNDEKLYKVISENNKTLSRSYNWKNHVMQISRLVSEIKQSS